MAGAVIIGAGPGIGPSVARRFGRGGLQVGLVARSQSSLDQARAALAVTRTPALTALLARQYGPGNSHVATVTVGGAVAPGSQFDPDRIAEHYWRLHDQPRDAWEHEFAFAGEPAVD